MTVDTVVRTYAVLRRRRALSGTRGTSKTVTTRNPEAERESGTPASSVARARTAASRISTLRELRDLPLRLGKLGSNVNSKVA